MTDTRTAQSSGIALQVFPKYVRLIDGQILFTSEITKKNNTHICIFIPNVHYYGHWGRCQFPTSSLIQESQWGRQEYTSASVALSLMTTFVLLLTLHFVVVLFSLLLGHYPLPQKMKTVHFLVSVLTVWIVLFQVHSKQLLDYLTESERLFLFGASPHGKSKNLFTTNSIWGPNLSSSH